MPAIPDVGAPSRNIYSVSRLNHEVRTLLERGLGVLWVEGELTNFSQPASGHWYFSLKDHEGQLRCAMFRMKNALVGFTPRPGMQVLLRGRLSVYEARGEYQLIAEHLEEAGVGALKREFERLKARLAAEGLFARERKRAPPRFPHCIGIVTSPSGAALHDILQILGRRFPRAPVIIYPARVQGADAAPSLVAALRRAALRAECDVLIMARGGGSLEDLWAFNDERLARTIHASPMPVVSAVGHEIDFTIADFVADVRAPTPSAAAELVTPDRSAWLETFTRVALRLTGAMRRELRAHAAHHESHARRLQLAHPGVRLQQQMQRLDDLAQRLGGAARAGLHRERAQLAETRARLLRNSPRQPLLERLSQCREARTRLEHALSMQLRRAEHRFDLARRALNSVSPLATLQRGFAILTRADGSVVTDATALAIDEEIEARLARGGIRARVTERK
jgi:exodeoxyribonuclease VII large subunit